MAFRALVHAVASLEALDVFAQELAPDLAQVEDLRAIGMQARIGGNQDINIEV